MGCEDIAPHFINTWGYALKGCRFIDDIFQDIKNSMSFFLNGPIDWKYVSFGLGNGFASNRIQVNTLTNDDPIPNMDHPPLMA